MQASYFDRQYPLRTLTVFQYIQDQLVRVEHFRGTPCSEIYMDRRNNCNTILQSNPTQPIFHRDAAILVSSNMAVSVIPQSRT